MLYASRVIPYRGSWLDFEFDHKDLVYIRIDRRRKLLASILLKALGMANQEILETFYESETYSVTPQGFSLKINSRRLMGRISPVEIKDKDGKDTIVEKGQRITARHIRLIDSNKIKTISLDSEGLNGLITAEDIINKETGSFSYHVILLSMKQLLKLSKSRNLKKLKFYTLMSLNQGLTFQKL